MVDLRNHNRQAWDKNVAEENEFTVPVDEELIEYARKGELAIFLSPGRPMPQDWLPEVKERDILCLAAGGGQQGPLLAAAGGRVTVFDVSPKQLAQDRLVAKREQLSLETVEGDMSDLSIFADESFDLIVNPVSTLYVSDVRAVWSEAFRVLRGGGLLLAGFMNPAFYIFDRDLLDEQGVFKVKHSLPYSDLSSLSSEALQSVLDGGWPLEFSHTLEDLIGGQIEAGFVLTGLYEDRDPRTALYEYMPVYIATRGLKT